MRVAVVGAGAIGGFLAGALARSGSEVVIVARGAHLAAIRKNGLVVSGDLGSFTVRVTAAETIAGLEFDALLLTFKAHQWPGFLDQLRPHASSEATIATFQNGLPFWYVRKPALESVDPGGRIGALFADSRIVGAAVHVSAHLSAPGAVRQSGGTRLVLGDPAGRGNERNERVEALSACLRAAGLQPEIDSDIRKTVWLKLANNVGLNPISAIEGKTLRPILSDERTRSAVRDLIVETLAVGRALGVVREVDVEARIDYAARLADVKTSMLQDIELGRPLEIEPMLGAVIELADRLDVAVPHVRDVYARIHALEKAR
ncbi:MAG TPA: 2-dehydropantoate 2-reductase [Verrucomicrobiae bacterium]|nr:2-dehydropantoate 2-reductase [Verrucomicrobiae bacterium]